MKEKRSVTYCHDMHFKKLNGIGLARDQHYTNKAAKI